MERRHKQRGSAIIEMTLVGIPLIFILISIFEVSRGMWIYHTLSYAAREGTRYVIVHGQNCQTTPNTCGITPKDLGNFLNIAAAGLEPKNLTVRFISGTTLLNPGTAVDDFTCTLDTLISGSCKAAVGTGCSGGSAIPSCAAASIGSPVVIRLTYPFSSAISMFWPGAGPGMVFGKVTLPAVSQDLIQF